MTDISRFVYKGPHFEYLRKNWKLDTTRCASRVHANDRTRFGSSRQCNRKPKEKIQGYGFCAQHASKVRNRLGITKSIKTIYVTDLSTRYGFTIWRMQVQRETKKQYYVFDIETLFGKGGYYQNAVSKHAAHDNLNSAIEQVIDKLQDRIQSLRKQQERHVQEITALQAMLK